MGAQGLDLGKVRVNLGSLGLDSGKLRGISGVDVESSRLDLKVRGSTSRIRRHYLEKIRGSSSRVWGVIVEDLGMWNSMSGVRGLFQEKLQEKTYLGCLTI